MLLNESTENYLEHILMLRQTRDKVRAVDLAASLNFSKPSVSTALKRLQNQGYITIADDHSITLTEKGIAVADGVYQRHVILKNYFIALGVDPETANADACKIEHDLSETTFQCIKKHYELLNQNL